MTKLKDIMEKMNVRPCDLAVKAQVNMNYISSLRSGTVAPGIGIATKVANVLGVKPEDIWDKFKNATKENA
jgi:transcriptional regulator with XRE-family HTH domain